MAKRSQGPSRARLAFDFALYLVCTIVLTTVTMFEAFDVFVDDGVNWWVWAFGVLALFCLIATIRHALHWHDHERGRKLAELVRREREGRL